MGRFGSHSSAGARVGALAARKAKPKAVSETELRASELRFDLDSVVRVLRAPRLAVTNEDLATLVTKQHASYERREVVRAVANLSDGG
jgi:hypothetical protein